ncbi:MAG: hypothetical protein JWQ38_3720 [Flavipsychrobacter sp.]|nr:hypothetical protein [Flavipsychrobacter sp.]
MNKVQFFYNDDLLALERKVNKWLAANKDINIIETNLTAIGKPSQRAGFVNTEKYVFYIRYQIIDKGIAISANKAEEIMSSAIEETDSKTGLNLANN